ncbi:MAG TPA: class I SAM-dependent methyltransferase [Thermoanaerobaculia bacterium]|nr:class I SAM-dependent methyltransferase [Thermoanaerobaculia bacterium]
MSDPRAFYDDLAEDYERIYADWDASVRGQGALIERWLREGDDAARADAPLRVLDVACGMGTQAIGLALRGHAVIARDLSPKLVERAREAAARLGASLDLGTADMREPAPGTGFDAVIALDNALPHLDTDDDLQRALRAARDALRPGGRYLASIRDYDRLADERPTLEPPRVLGEGASRRIVLQHWEWDADGAGYDLDLLIVARDETGAWSLRARRGRYRALRRAALEGAAERAGLVEPRWIEPEESGFYQPLFGAHRPPSGD